MSPFRRRPRLYALRLPRRPRLCMLLLPRHQWFTPLRRLRLVRLPRQSGSLHRQWPRLLRLISRLPRSTPRHRRRLRCMPHRRQQRRPLFSISRCPLFGSSHRRRNRWPAGGPAYRRVSSIVLYYADAGVRRCGAPAAPSGTCLTGCAVLGTRASALCAPKHEHSRMTIAQD